MPNIEIDSVNSLIRVGGTPKIDINDVRKASESYTKAEVYAKTETYTKIEIDANVLKLASTLKRPSKDVIFTKTSPSSFNIQVGVGTQYVKLTSVYSLSLNTNLDTGTKVAGTDYYVYSKPDGTFFISANNAITTSQLIGGFHYGLVGELEAISGNKLEADMVCIRGINQYSFWDLGFRPISSPNGMVYINGKWYDIYLLNSEHITNGTSKAGLTIAGGVTGDGNGRNIPKIPLEYGGNNTLTYGKFTWFQACEIAKANNKQLLSYAEFPTIAYGVLENVSSLTNSYETIVGKIEHYTNLTSKYGIEQATGVQWIWGADLANYPTDTVWAWKSQTDSRGQIYSTDNSPTAVTLGGNRGNGVSAGSRASDWNDWVWRSNWDIGCRFSSLHLSSHS
jgi:hypothetical protein